VSLYIAGKALEVRYVQCYKLTLTCIVSPSQTLYSLKRERGKGRGLVSLSLFYYPQKEMGR